MRRRDLVVWSSSRRYGGPARTGHPRRFRRRLRTGALLAAFGLIRAVRAGRVRPRLAFGLSGGVLTVIGIVLSSAAVLIPGILVLLVTALLPPDPSAWSGGDAGRPRRWAEPCLPFFAAQRGPGDR